MMLTFSEINSKLKGVAIDITTRNMLTFRTTFHAYIVNRPVESVFLNKFLGKVNLTYLYVPSNSLNSLDTQNFAYIF